jgi:hypothetical protein
MKIGDILYHEKYGKLVVIERKYSPVGNKVVFITRDGSGVKHGIDGTEIPYQEHKRAVESSKKVSSEKTLKDSEDKKRHYDVVSMISDVKNAIESGNKAILEKEVVHVETKDVKIPDFPAFPDKMTVNVPDLSSIEKKLDVLIRSDDGETNDLIREAIDELKNSKNDKELAKAIINVGKSIPNTPDYSEILKEISEKLVDTPVESMRIDEDQFKLLTKAISNIRSGGGGGGLVAVMDKDREQINPATEEKQDILSSYARAGQDISGDPMYFAGLKQDGSWFIKRMYLSGDYTTKYANGTSGFDWSSRASLTYADFNTLTW